MKIGIMGLGTVGSAVARVLAENRDLVAERAGCPLDVGWVLVRDPARPRELPPGARLTGSAADLLGDPEVEVVVEVMGGIEPARRYILDALARGKTVVTANKDLVAAYGEELQEAAARGGAELFFEAAVGGGIPIIRALKESLAGNRIATILAIINGTTNYILTRMERDGLRLEEALREAQARGYAEADPREDLDGLDAGRKLAILAAIAFGARVRPGDLFVEGIGAVEPADIDHARRLGMTIKLLAVAKATPQGLDLRVHPALLPTAHPLAAVHDAMNAVFVTGDAVGEAMFYGPGAGGGPTASSVVGDLIDAARRRLAGSRGSGPPRLRDVPLMPAEEAASRYYLRLQVADRPGVLARVAGVLGEAGVSVNSLVQTPLAGGQAELVLITHEARERQIRRVRAELAALGDVRGRVQVLRVEEPE